MSWKLSDQELWVLLAIFLGLVAFEAGPKLLNMMKKRKDSKKA